MTNQFALFEYHLNDFFNQTAIRIGTWIRFDDGYDIISELKHTIADITSQLGATIKKNDALAKMDELASLFANAKNNPQKKAVSRKIRSIVWQSTKTYLPIRSFRPH
ncbi:hypothetical protein [Sutterella sp.]|uniref:hypothetical protein n=1 Tax=Sutterella sp. TaxID=1981025 RepID=UPI003FD87ABB